MADSSACRLGHTPGCRALFVITMYPHEKAWAPEPSLFFTSGRFVTLLIRDAARFARNIPPAATYH